jgi:hypothetical protein
MTKTSQKAYVSLAYPWQRLTSSSSHTKSQNTNQTIRAPCTISGSLIAVHPLPVSHDLVTFNMDAGGGTQRTARPRLYHTKSRTGCVRCRGRRVKVGDTRGPTRNGLIGKADVLQCNEARPVCVRANL